MKEITISIPEGTDKFTVKIEGGEAKVIYDHSEKKEWQPQDGEIVFATQKGLGEEHFIFPYGYMTDANVNDVLCDMRLNINTGNEWICTVERPATEEEKKMFHDALKEKGLRWNAEEKKVEPIPRWRAEKNEEYYYVCADAEVEHDLENGCSGDDTCYSIGNYFKTREAAERVAGQIKEIFKNSKAE